MFVIVLHPNTLALDCCGMVQKSSFYCSPPQWLALVNYIQFHMCFQPSPGACYERMQAYACEYMVKEYIYAKNIAIRGPGLAEFCCSEDTSRYSISLGGVFIAHIDR